MTAAQPFSHGVEGWVDFEDPGSTDRVRYMLIEIATFNEGVAPFGKIFLPVMETNILFTIVKSPLTTFPHMGM